MEETGRITVAIVEGNQFLRSGIRQALESQPDLRVLADFEHAAGAVAEMNELAPDVVLVSSVLPDIPGFEGCVRLMEATPRPRAIMMCSAITETDVFAAWMAGASGCLLLGGAEEDLVRTVRANGRGEMFHIRPVAESALRFAQYRPRYVDTSLLTGRERRMMRLVADGFSNRAIAAELELTRYTIGNYMSTIFAKLGIASRAEIGALGVLLGVMDEVDEWGPEQDRRLKQPMADQEPSVPGRRFYELLVEPALEETGHITVAIVEGNQFLRSGIRQALESQPDMQVIAEFNQAASAIAELNDLAPDVVLVSSVLPDIPGFEACVRLIDAELRPKVIMMFSAITAAEVYAGWMAGAAGCLLLGGAVEDLVRTVRANGRGEMFHIPLVAESALRFAQYNSRHIDISTLAGRERQIMSLVAGGYSNKAIAAELELATHTVGNHLTAIYRRLGIARRSEIGALSVLLGMMDGGDEEGMVEQPRFLQTGPALFSKGSAMEETCQIAVAIVEGNRFLRSGIRQTLESQPDMRVAGEFDDGASAVASMNGLEASVVLVGSALPDMSGFEACVRLMDAGPLPRVIMMCPAITDVEVFSGWMAGAAGCLLTGGTVDELVRTVRANGRGEILLIKMLADRILRFAQHNPRYVDIRPLTGRERQIVRLVAGGLSNGAIAAELDLTRYTVRNYVSAIIDKLGLARRAELGVFGG